MKDKGFPALVLFICAAIAVYDRGFTTQALYATIANFVIAALLVLVLVGLFLLVVGNPAKR